MLFDYTDEFVDRQAMGPGYLAPVEMQSDPGYSSRGQYGDDVPSSSRPRPVGGSTGTHFYTVNENI